MSNKEIIPNINDSSNNNNENNSNNKSKIKFMKTNKSKYKAKKLNTEGIYENAKVYWEITNIDIKRKLKEISEIFPSYI